MKKATVIFLFFVTAVVSAQRFEIVSGKLANLKGISEYNVAFDYTGMQVNGFESEEAFLKEKMGKREKVEGKAEKFKEEWYANRKSMYEPAFISYFNKSFKNGEIKVGENPEANYTMAIKTTWIYPGYNAGTDIEPAKISAVITVSETKNPTNVLLVIGFDKSIGLSHELGNTLGDRISWAYEKLAKNLAIQLKRFL